jgi:NTP-dependent ternary system trypsin peptidase co-occuring protein
VEGVRRQLIEAMGRSADKDLRFTLGEVELEFAVSLTQDSNVTGGIKVWVLNVGSNAGESIARTHRIKVTLKPVDPRTGEAAQSL